MGDDAAKDAKCEPAHQAGVAGNDSTGNGADERIALPVSPVDPANREDSIPEASSAETRSLRVVQTDARDSLGPEIVGYQAAEPHESRGVRRLTPLLLGVTVLLILALVCGGIYAMVEIGRRDSLIAKHQATIDSLSAANLSFQEQVADLTNQRDQLSRERDELTRERDSLTARIADLERREAELNQDLAERDRLLRQAREESSRQQNRAEAAEAVGMTLAMILDVDEEIHQAFVDLLVTVAEMEEATRVRNSFAYQRANDRALVLMGRIDELFARREALIATLPW